MTDWPTITVPEYTGNQLAVLHELDDGIYYLIPKDKMREMTLVDAWNACVDDALHPDVRVLIVEDTDDENDKELAAIRACWAVLDSLDHAARVRVVTWLQSRVWAEKSEYESRPSVVEDTDD